MRYRLTCLTPLLVGDGQKLSPIDYMVWKDQVNVLDQRRIFRLLAKGPRLDGYLVQLKKATKLDFASWGGFAQNFADRRVPFESPGSASYWERASGESLHIPTFVTGLRGPYLPGTAIKGALRTALVCTSVRNTAMRELAAGLQGERSARYAAAALEEQTLGHSGVSRTRSIQVADSDPIDRSAFRVHLLRVSTLLPKGPSNYSLGWKLSPRGSVDGRKPEESTPHFAEMAVPGTTFEGEWRERAFFSQPEVRRVLRWPEASDRMHQFSAANKFAAQVLELHKKYAAWAGLDLLQQTIAGLEARLASVSESEAGRACVLVMGWGSGLLSKSAWLDTSAPEYRQVMRNLPLYENVAGSPLPFPKTRRIVFTGNRPASLPGWVLLEVV